MIPAGPREICLKCGRSSTQSEGAQNTAHGIEACGLQWAVDTDLLSWAQMGLFSKLVLDQAAEKHFRIKAKMKEQCVLDFVPNSFLFLLATLGLGDTKVNKCLQRSCIC